MGKPETVPTLLRSLQHLSYEESYLAGRALVKIGDSSICPELIRILGSPDSGVRISALEVLGDLGSDSDVPLIRPLLKDPGRSARGKVAERAERAITLIEERSRSRKK
jgi:HEAT repeat protein